jgi:ferredoxin-NADP reductase
LISEASIDDGIAFICGSNGFVETASELVISAGYEPQRVRTERFGPSG